MSLYIPKSTQKNIIEHGIRSESIGKYYYKHFVEKGINGKKFVKPERLSPTKSALKYHLFRALIIKYKNGSTQITVLTQLTGDLWKKK